MTVHSLRNHRLYVAPVRIALGVLWLAAGRLAGVGSASALLAFVGGAFVLVFVSLQDPRAAFLRRREPEPLPPDAQVASPVRQALQALLPSTAGLSVLAAIAIVPAPALSVLLGGIIAGLGVAGVLHAIGADPGLFFDRGTGKVYRR